MQGLIIDSFAGGGGASLGITWATGQHPDIAINHDLAAIMMHKTNHPSTTHYTEDVWKMSPRKVTGGRPIDLLWASPDCKHFSRAKGGKPVDKNIRSLAWVVVKWAEQCRPKNLFLENVLEFSSWAPLVPRWHCTRCHWKGTEGQATLTQRRRTCPDCNSTTLRQTTELIPDPDRRGLTFKRFTDRLRNLGYHVEWKVLDAADFGAPTRRRRLFLIGRRDGQPIQWPNPTHGDPNKRKQHGLLPWNTAASCINWTLPCPSIFDRKKSLVHATLRRIALGIKRYVLDSQRPFIVRCNHGGDHFRGQPTDQPMCTVTASRDAHGLVLPILSKYHGQKQDESRGAGPDAPIRTLDTQPRVALLTPAVMSVETDGHRPPTSPQLPLFGLSDLANNDHTHPAQAAAFLHRYDGNRVGQSVDQPGPTESQTPQSPLVTAFVAKHFGGMIGIEADTPLPTTTARGTQNQLVTANLIHLNHGSKQWSGVDEPMRTVTTNNHAYLVYSFLTKYCDPNIRRPSDNPFQTAANTNRAGLVTLDIDGETYVLVDIGMRMLTPRELARAQGFPDSYVWTGSKTNQIAKIGNSVCPQVAEALVKANYCQENMPTHLAA